MSAFSRSTRSLAVDAGRGPVVALVLATLILGSWLAWFLLARLAIYEVSATASLTQARQVAASFPTTALGHLRPGQAAQIRFDSFPWDRYGTVAATVTIVADQARDGAVLADFAIDPGPALPLRAGMTGVVEVEVEQVSPAELLLRAVGQRR